jgi:hypothetical protein
MEISSSLMTNITKTIMIDYYYQIKGKRGKDEEGMFSNWAFPPIFSGKVTAKNKKEAKQLICEDYDKQFPLRVLREQLDRNEYLLSIEEIKPNSHIERLFNPQSCKQCGDTFYVIDKYNDKYCTNKSSDFCTDKCFQEHKEAHYFKRMDNDLLVGSAMPVIYKITNKVTGMVYIGKTSQVFTLRWYQHFFQFGGSKFHEAIRTSKVTDWLFEVQEIIEFPQELREMTDMNLYLDQREKYIFERERHWINHYKSIESGYNTL